MPPAISSQGADPYLSAMTRAGSALETRGA